MRYCPNENNSFSHMMSNFLRPWRPDDASLCIYVSLYMDIIGPIKDLAPVWASYLKKCKEMVNE